MAAADREGAVQRGIPSCPHRGATIGYAAKQGSGGGFAAGRIRQAIRPRATAKCVNRVFCFLPFGENEDQIEPQTGLWPRDRPVSGFLLDTNVISELVRPRPDPHVTGWIDETDERLLYLSVLTLGEIRNGIMRLPDPRRRVELERWLDSSLALRFSDRILPVDMAVADRWGRLSAEAVVRRAPLPVIDALLAATALQ